MGTRTISGAVIILVTAILTLLSSYTFALFTLFVAAASICELLKIAQRGGYSPQRGVALAISLLIILLNVSLLEIFPFEQAQHLIGQVALFALPLITIIVLFVELTRDSRKPLENSAITLFSIIYIGLSMSLVSYIPRLMNGGEWSGAIMLGYFFLLWANDSFAYLFGVTLGTRPLLKRISPKKSIEGFIGGVIGTVVISLIAAWVLGGSLRIWVSLSIVVSLSAVVGDLVQSMIKRSFNEKDSGDIIPGHGGIWDRFDSLLYSIPLAILYLYILNLLALN